MSTLIFWGAGATAELGIRMTAQQATFIKGLVGDDSTPLCDRVTVACEPGRQHSTKLLKAVTDLLHILGDDCTPNQLYMDKHGLAKTAYERQMAGCALDESQYLARLFQLRSLYNWPALKLICKICPAWGTKDFQINDLFNVLDMHRLSGHGFQVEKDIFLNQQQVLGAYQALILILQTLFYIDYQAALETKKEQLELYYQFSETIARRMQQKGLGINPRDFAKREHFLGEVAFASLNYDPIGLWSQFIANSNLNNQADVPHVDKQAVPLKIFHDLGHFMAVRTIENPDGLKDNLWYPLNEASAQRLNDHEHCTGRRVLLTKYLFPHGCLCWRECPSCGKLTANFGDRWDLRSPTLLPPPPLPGFVVERPNNGTDKEKEKWNKGKVDARECVHCHAMTYAHHGSAVMQSSFKVRPAPFIEEIQRELRVAIEKADHIIFMGYSLPPDDVTYRALFAARKSRSEHVPVRCSVVTGRGGADAWLTHDQFSAPGVGEDAKKTIEAAISIFGQENVRYYGGGIPQVFSDGTACDSDKVETLLNWNAT